MPVRDVEGAVVAHLAAAGIAGVTRVGTEVPADRPRHARFLVVRRVGGGGDALVSRPAVRVSAYAESATEAALLADAVELAMLSLPASDPFISSVRTNRIYEAAWAGTATRDGSPCYEALFDLVANR